MSTYHTPAAVVTVTLVGHFLRPTSILVFTGVDFSYRDTKSSVITSIPFSPLKIKERLRDKRCRRYYVYIEWLSVFLLPTGMKSQWSSELRVGSPDATTDTRRAQKVVLDEVDVSESC